MASTFGTNIKISIFGESHGMGIGVVIDGLPAGEKLDVDALQKEMNRRAPGNDPTATPRRESDIPEICSGILEDTTTGAPLCAVIENANTRSVDYERIYDDLYADKNRLPGWLLSEEGMTFLFEQGDFFGRAFGCLEVTVPYEKVGKYLRKEYR